MGSIASHRCSFTSPLYKYRPGSYFPSPRAIISQVLHLTCSLDPCSRASRCSCLFSSSQRSFCQHGPSEDWPILLTTTAHQFWHTTFWEVVLKVCRMIQYIFGLEMLHYDDFKAGGPPSYQLFITSAPLMPNSCLFSSCFYHIEVGRRGNTHMVY